MAWLKSQADAVKAKAILDKFPDRRQLSDTDRNALAMLQREVGQWTNAKGGMYIEPRHPGDVVSKQEARGPAPTGQFDNPNDATLGEHAIHAVKSLASTFGVPTSAEGLKDTFVGPGGIDIPGTNRYVPNLLPTMYPLAGQAANQVRGQMETAQTSKGKHGLEKAARIGAGLVPVAGPLAVGAADQMTPAIAKAMQGEQSTKEEQLNLTGGGTQLIGALLPMHEGAQERMNKVGENLANRKLKNVTKKMSAQGPAKHLQGSLSEFLPNNGMDTRAARGEQLGNALVDEYGSKFPDEKTNQKRLEEYTAHREKHIIESGAKVPEHKALNAMLSDAVNKSMEEIHGRVATENSPVGREVLGILQSAKEHGWTPDAYARLRELGAGPPPEIKEAVKQSKSGASAAARKAEASAKNAKSAQQKLTELETAQTTPDAAKLEKARASALKAQQVAQDAANFAEESSLAYQDAEAVMEQHKSFPLPKQLQDAIKFTEVTRDINGGTLQDLPASAIDEAKRRATKKVNEASFNKEPTDADKSQAEFYRNIGTKLRRAVIDSVNESGVAAPENTVKYKRPGESDTEFLHRRVAELRGIQEVLKNKRIQSESPVPLNQTVLAPSGTGVKKYMNVEGGLGGAAGAVLGFGLSGGNPIGALAGAPIGAVMARATKDLWRAPETHQWLANARREGFFGQPNSDWYREQIKAGNVPSAKPPRGTTPAASGMPSGKGSTQYNNSAGENIPTKKEYPQRRVKLEQEAIPPPAVGEAPAELAAEAMRRGALRDNGKSLREWWKQHGKTIEEKGGLTQRKLDWVKTKATKEVPLKVAMKNGEDKERPPKKASPPPKKAAAESMFEDTYEKSPEVKARKAKEAKGPEKGNFAKGTSRSEYAQKALDNLLTPEQKARMKNTVKGSQPTEPKKVSREEAKAEVARLHKSVKDKVAAGDADGAVKDMNKVDKLEDAIRAAEAKDRVKTPETAPGDKVVPANAKEPKGPIGTDVKTLTPKQRAEKLVQYKDDLARAQKNKMQGDSSRITWLQKRIKEIEELGD